MEGVFGLLIVAGAGSVAYLLFWLRSQDWIRSWRRAAESAGVTGIEAPTMFGIGLKLTGHAGGLAVGLETYSRGKYEHGTRIVVGGLQHGAYGLSLRAEGVTSVVEKAFGEREIEVGDPAFDQAAYLQGSPSLIRAIFDGETRRVVRALLADGVRVEGPAGGKTLKRLRVSVSDNELRVDIPSSLFDRTESWLPNVLPQLLTIGSRLRRPDDMAARLAANVRGEPLEAVRLLTLRSLTAEFPGHQATHDALAAALADDSLEVRLHAAIALGPEGMATLQALASGREEDAVAARAIAALGPAFPVDRAAARLRQAHAAGQDAAALACLDVLGRSGAAAAVDPLVEALASSRSAVAAAAARALGALGHEAAELPVIAALGHESGDVRVAAAESLGQIGTPQAVVPLREASESHRIDRDLWRATRQAIAQIQGRISGASPGQLSLADGQAGQVSLAEADARGRVSMEGGAIPPAPRTPRSRP